MCAEFPTEFPFPPENPGNFSVFRRNLLFCGYFTVDIFSGHFFLSINFQPKNGFCAEPFFSETNLYFLNFFVGVGNGNSVGNCVFRAGRLERDGPLLP